MGFRVARRLENRCQNCGFCLLQIACAGEKDCTGCGACVAACPYEAKILEPSTDERSTIEIEIEGQTFEVPDRVTVLEALGIAGYSIGELPGADIHAPCRTGGCWSCAVSIDGGLKPCCIARVREGMRVSLAAERFEPLRLVTGFHGHHVGGVGTPYQLKPRGIYRYIEVACFAHGCILRCPTCQNWESTYSSSGEPLTPLQAARRMTEARRLCGVNRMAISGGEPTLNRRWLIGYFLELRRLNPDKKARFHLDTNAVLLTPDYLDELVQVGMTDIGIDVKGLELQTFMRITGTGSKDLARRFLETEWNALKHMLDHHQDGVFIGVGIPYNPELISLPEVRKIGERIAGMDLKVQVCALDYRPEFRRRDLVKPTYEQMVEVKKVLEEAGLKCVICQTEYGHIGP